MKAASLFCGLLLLAGCTSFFGAQTRQGVSSSLVDYLYPQGEKPEPPSDAIPHLQLPLKVGLAFVPSHYEGGALAEADRTRLLNGVKEHFAGRDFIQKIEVIPDAYMRTGGGFTSLEQTARLYGLDVMALVSYDQVTHTDERKRSLLYWTIVGAYVVKGNKNDVQTFVDTAVFDVPTRQLLFRAPGVSEVKDTSTLTGLDRNLRAGQQKGFEQAMADMTVNLDKELGSFKERIKTDGSVRVTRAGAPTEGGGGSTGPGWLALLFLITLASMRRRT